MVRIGLLSDDASDADVRTHLALLESVAAVDVVARRVENSLSLIGRTAARLLRRPPAADVLVTVGEAPLTAAALAWRGPIVHLPVGMPTPAERRLIGWRSRVAPVRMVLSSYANAARCTRANGASPLPLTVIRPGLPESTAAGRVAVRADLRIADDAVVVALPEESGPDAYRRALWVSGILAFRNAAWRILLPGSADTPRNRRLALATHRPDATVFAHGLDAASTAQAADVMLVTGDAPTSVATVAGAIAAGVPIVAAARPWSAERLTRVPAHCLDDARPRLMARGVLDVAEGIVRVDVETARRALRREWSPETSRHDWVGLLELLIDARQPHPV